MGNCEGDLEVPFVRNNTVYKAGNALFSTAIIPSGTTADFTAGQYIDLQEGFHAELGSDFDTSIEDCATLTTPEMIVPIATTLMDNGCDNSINTKEWYFEWTEIPNAATYHLVIYAPDSAVPILNKDDLVTNRFTFNDFEYIDNQRTDNWKVIVRANVQDQWTNWSTPQLFSIEALNSDCIKATSRNSATNEAVLPVLNKEVQLMIHPNPARDYVTINYFLNKVVTFDIHLYDLTGQQLQEIKPLKASSPGEHTIRLDTNQLPKGMYYIVLQNKDFTISEKLVVIE